MSYKAKAFMNKPIIIFATEIDLRNDLEFPFGNPVRYIKFPLDDGKYPICYRSRTSYNSFAHGSKDRNYSPNKKQAKFLYCCRHEEEIREFYKIPIVDVKNIWDFYNLIGYDYKNKKYK